MTEVHFLGVLDVGCTIIRHRSGRLTMIDINNGRSPSAGVDPLDDLDEAFPGDILHRHVQSHWDVRHMRGLTALVARRRVRYAWLPVASRSPLHADDAADQAKGSTFAKLRREQMAGVQVIAPLRQQAMGARDKSVLDGLSIVMPTPERAEFPAAAEGIPPVSYLLGLKYGSARVLLAGECEQQMWRQAVRDRNIPLPCTILHATHPVGRRGLDFDAAAFCPALDLMRPQHVVLSGAEQSEARVQQAYLVRCAAVTSLALAGVAVVRIDQAGMVDVTTRGRRHAG